jgi:TolA-binding protein
MSESLLTTLLTVLVSTITTLIIFLVTIIVGKTQKAADLQKTNLGNSSDKLKVISDLEAHIGEQAEKILSLTKEVERLQGIINSNDRKNSEEVNKVKEELQKVLSELEAYKAYVQLLCIRMKRSGVEFVPLEEIVQKKNAEQT